MLTLGLAAAAGGCLSPRMMLSKSSLPVDANSPVAKDVIYASQHPGPFPRFADIPKTPSDDRPPAAWTAAAQDVEARKAALDAQVARLPPVQTGAEDYAVALRARFGEKPNEVPPPDQTDQTEAYAQSLRARATPPPSPK
jgi:hypothetical protein